MKHGILKYGQSERYYPNIGDYIQSLASRQYAGKEVIYIDRERLDEYDEENVKIVLNGWFMSDPVHFPPSSLISPLFVAFHITPSAKDVILSNKGIDYLKKYEPIGCRDIDTMYLLQKNGVDAYFSGCMTLTLGEKYSSNQKSGEIYFVDPTVQPVKSYIQFLRISVSEILHLPIILNIYSKIRSIGASRLRESVHYLYYSILLYHQYSDIFSDELLKNARFISHTKDLPDFKDVDSSINYAESLLEKYSKASLVVTSRIHAALPCLGMQTPCIFVDKAGLGQKRFGGLLDLLNVLQINNQKLQPIGNFISQYENIKRKSGKIDIKTEIRNDDRYVELKESLRKKCISFFNEM